MSGQVFIYLDGFLGILCDRISFTIRKPTVMPTKLHWLPLKSCDILIMSSWGSSALQASGRIINISVLRSPSVHLNAHTAAVPVYALNYS